MSQLRSARLVRLAVLGAGLACAAWALLDPRFRDPEGALDTGVCLPLAVAATIVGLGLLGRRKPPAAALWAALALLGQAAALQLIDAGPALHYQHLPPIQRLLAETNPLPLALLGAQAALVMFGCWRRRAELRAWLGGALRPWQAAGVAAVFVLTSAAVSAQVATWVGELVLASLVQAIALGNLLLVGVTAPRELLSRLARRSNDRADASGDRPRIDRFVLAAALWVVIAAAALNLLSYQAHPHITDEVTYLYHARFLAAGRLTMPAPAVPEAFELYLMQIDGDRWYPSTPPGWPAVLALGFLTGLPWLVNPLLGGIALVLVYLLFQTLYDRTAARWAVVLLCCSPWFVFMAMNFMNHTVTLTAMLGAAVAIARARRTGGVACAVLAGALVAAIGLIRPLDAVVVGALLALWVLGAGGRRLPLRGLAAFALGGLLVGGVALAYNRHLTGDPLSFPVMRYMNERWGPGSNSLGFGPDRGQGWALDPYPGHSPIDALVNANLNGFSINVELFGWSTGSLLLAAAALFSGALSRSDRLLVTLAAGVFAAHFFYYYSGGPDFGARYWYLMIVPLVALTVRGARLLAARLERPAAPYGGARLLAVAATACALALATYFPWRAIDKYHHLWGMRPDVRALAAERGFGTSLVLVRGEAYPDYVSAAAYNPVDLRGAGPVYAWDRNAEVRAAVLAAYPDRPVWRLDGPSLTGRGFEVVAGLGGGSARPGGGDDDDSR